MAERPRHLCPCRMLPGTDGRHHELAPHGEMRFSVLVFHASDCPILSAHAPRLREWSALYGKRGVQFLVIDSEVSQNLAHASADATRLGYAFPILLDEDAVTARALGAEYAGYAVILDRNGNVRFSGGIDSDRTQLSLDAALYLTDALDDLLADRPVRRTQAKALGCALRVR